MNFCHLHLHSEYSFLDGLCRIPELIKEAARLKMPAVALTDHGGLWGVVPFYKHCLKMGIKPIIGCEIYVVDNHLKTSKNELLHHLVLLAENNEGYHNLIKLVTESHLKGFFHVPRVDKDMLMAHHRGLIALSGCMKGEIPHYILENQLNEAKRAVKEYIEIFSKDNLFLELQNHGLEEEQKVSFWLNKLSQKLKIPLVATNDVHYLKPQDHKAHKILLSINSPSISQDALPFKKEYYLKSSHEMENLFLSYPDAIKNTMKIAERCNVELDIGGIHLPKVATPKGHNPQSLLEKFTLKGAKIRYNDPLSPSIKARLKHELSIIEKMGYAGYFLIVKDIVDYAKNHDIPVGVGRGSAAASVVSYCLGIIDIDPLQYNLIFERFLNPERLSPPDIDIDLCHRGRHQVLEYIRQHFGKERIAHVGAFSTLQARAVLRDVGKAFQLASYKIDKLCSFIPYSHIGLDEARNQSPHLSVLIQKDKGIQETFDTARHLQGLPRHMTQHSAGVAISEKPLTEYVPLERASGREIITQADMDILKDLGIVKIDLLGLRFLTVIKDTLQLVKVRRNIDIAPEDIPLNDDKALRALCTGNTTSTFQLESIGMRNILRNIRPKNIEDLSAVLALYRPGPLQSGMTREFIDRRHGEKNVSYLHPWLKPVLSNTYGVFLYQEQLMQTAHIIAGYTLGEADLLRRNIGKNDIKEQRDNFVKRAKKRGIENKTAERIFSILQSSGGFGFNKSHSVSYAITAYRTVFLKEHFPLEYFSALLSLYADTPARLRLYLSDTRRLGIKILGPHINKSEMNFTPTEDGAIRSGFTSVKNLGLRCIKEILRARKDKPFTGFFDFYHRTDRQWINSRAIESLILSGAFDEFELSRPTLLLCLKSIIKEKKVLPNQISIFPQESPTRILAQNVCLQDFTSEQKALQEFQALGQYITYHPMEPWEAIASQLRTHTAIQVSCIIPGEKVRLLGILLDLRRSHTRQGNLMMFAVLEDLTGSVELVIFPRELSFYTHLLVQDSPVIIDGLVDFKGECKTIIVEKIQSLKK